VEFEISVMEGHGFSRAAAVEGHGFSGAATVEGHGFSRAERTRMERGLLAPVATSKAAIHCPRFRPGLKPGSSASTDSKLTHYPVL